MMLAPDPSEAPSVFTDADGGGDDAMVPPEQFELDSSAADSTAPGPDGGQEQGSVGDERAAAGLEVEGQYVEGEGSPSRMEETIDVPALRGRRTDSPDPPRRLPDRDADPELRDQ